MYQGFFRWCVSSNWSNNDRSMSELRSNKGCKQEIHSASSGITSDLNTAVSMLTQKLQPAKPDSGRDWK